ncbi:hypothetical protein GbCGDNIH6_8168 [Granulibacter bethesdensis]|nr:hypothetical protein GbCGDNIH6_8168 [Granulibacter bethesdensis]
MRLARQIVYGEAGSGVSRETPYRGECIKCRYNSEIGTLIFVRKQLYRIRQNGHIRRCSMADKRCFR